MKHLVFIPAYNCQAQIGRVLAQFEHIPAGVVDRILVIDNRSPDSTLETACEAAKLLDAHHVTVCRNVDNYGLGGSQKVGFEFARQNGFKRVTILHGDDQGAIEDLLPQLRDASTAQADALLGARFMPGSRLTGYSSFRTFGNHVFNLLFSIVAGKRLYDLGSGLNSYRTRIFDDGFHLPFPDDLTFNYSLVLAHVQLRHSMRFFPIHWREDDQISNVKLTRQAGRVLKMLGAFALGRERFLRTEQRAVQRVAYPSEIVFDKPASTP